MSEWTSEWPSTYVSILDRSEPLCAEIKNVGSVKESGVSEWIDEIICHRRILSNELKWQICARKNPLRLMRKEFVFSNRLRSSLVSQSDKKKQQEGVKRGIIQPPKRCYIQVHSVFRIIMIKLRFSMSSCWDSSAISTKRKQQNKYRGIHQIRLVYRRSLTMMMP